MKFALVICSFFVALGLMAQVTPEVDGDIYSLSFKNIEFKVDASRGAKVLSLNVSGNEFLVTEEESSGYLWGSTLWSAPQSEWGWPPENYFPNIEDGVYAAQVSETTMSFESVDEFDMIFTKAFTASEEDTAINITYTMKNTGENARTNALWELTRPHVNGLTFWPTGPGGAWNNLASSIIEKNDYSWLDIDAETRNNLKFMADASQGWYAHVDANRTLLLKTFDDVDQADFANGEGEIELWIANDYIELENLSAAKTLETNEVLNYDVKWYVREVPANIPVEVGSTALLNYVNKILGLDPIISVKNNAALSCKAYPNPARQTIQFTWPVEHANTAQLKIYDAMGKLQLHTMLKQNNSVNIAELKSGVLFYSLTIENEVINGRFIKE